MPKRFPIDGGPGGRPTPNSPLYATGGGAGIAAAGGPGNEPVIYSPSAKPVPARMAVSPRITQNAARLQPPPQPMPQINSASRGPIADDRFFHVGDGGGGSALRRRPPANTHNEPNFNTPGQWMAYGSGRSAADDGRYFNVGGGYQPPARGAAGPLEWQAYGSPSRGRRQREPELFWEPPVAEVPKPPRRSGGNRPRGPLLPGNSAPAYGASMAGTSQSLPGGWWHDPTYAVKNAGGWWHDPSGAGQDLNRLWSGLSPSGAPLSGGGGGFLGGYQRRGGGGGNDIISAYEAAMAAANAANESRYNTINSGYTSGRRRASGLLDQLGDMQRYDTNRAYDANSGKIAQDAINTGLTSSTVRSNLLTGNERKRGESLARVNESLTQNRLNTEMPLLKEQLDFMERRNDVGPDLGMFARLLAQAGSNPGYGGGGMMIDSTPYGMQGYAMPMFGGGYLPRGSQLQRGSGIRGIGFGSGMGGLMGGGEGGSGSAFADGVSAGTSIFGGSGGWDPLGSYTGEGDINSIGSVSPPVGRPPDWSLGMGGYPADYDYGALFGNGSGADYQWGSYSPRRQSMRNLLGPWDY